MNATFMPVIVQSFNQITYNTYKFADIQSTESSLNYTYALISYLYFSEASGNIYYPEIQQNFHNKNESDFTTIQFKSSYNIVQGINMTFYVDNKILHTYSLGNKADYILDMKQIQHLFDDYNDNRWSSDTKQVKYE